MVSLAAIIASLCLISFASGADELITLNPRPGVTQHVLLWRPSSPDSRLVILIFPGGNGNLVIKSGDKIGNETEYLFSRHRNLLMRHEVAVAVIDAPSDHPNMGQKFRRSNTHIEDMTAVVKELKNRYDKARLILLGHSRGTISAAYVAQALSDRIAAVILMSGIYNRNLSGSKVGLSKFDFDALRVPILIVHHAKDFCPASLFIGAQKLTERFPAIIVEGREEDKSYLSCLPGTNHWFDGKEKETIDEVFHWINGRVWSRIIR
jgi:predicted esterase